jgi:hypothetical protein
MTADVYLSWSDATDLVRAHTGASVGRAEKYLRLARKSDEVRTKAIIPREAGTDPIWYGDDMIEGADLGTEMVLTEFGVRWPPVPNGAGFFSIRHFEKGDLIDWLNRNAEPPPRSTTTPQQPGDLGPKLGPATKAARAKWSPDGMAPKNMPLKEVHSAVLDQLAKDGNDPVSESVALRAAGRKKSYAKSRASKPISAMAGHGRPGR